MHNTNKNTAVKLLTEEFPNISIMYRLPIEVYVYLPATEEDFIKYENEITRDFVKIISGVNVIEFESFNLIPRRILNMFISLCKIYSTNSEFPILINDILNNYYGSQYIHYTPSRPSRPSRLDYIPNTLNNTLNYTPNTLNNTLNNTPNTLTNTLNYTPNTLNYTPNTLNYTPNILNNTPIFTRHNEYKHITQENIGDSEIPKRFEINGNINREVLISDNNTNYIENYNIPIIGQNNEINNVEEKIVMNPSHIIQLLDTCRLSEDTIKNITEKIYNNIKNTKVRPPNFNNYSRSGYRRIKNFIHNITRTWLNQKEIDIFIREINILKNKN